MPFPTRSRMELHPAPGSKWSSKLHKMYQSRCTTKNSWRWAGRLPETCRVVIPINLEFSASVGFIHKQFVTMHGHMILKYSMLYDNAMGWAFQESRFYSWKGQEFYFFSKEAASDLRHTKFLVQCATWDIPWVSRGVYLKLTSHTI
jgi:hypothetical protein